MCQGICDLASSMSPDLLAENGRLNNTHGIISAFSTMMSVHRGEVPCTVTTASVSSRLRSPGVEEIEMGRPAGEQPGAPGDRPVLTGW